MTKLKSDNDALTVYYQQQQACHSACNVTDELLATLDNQQMRCVTCPFCKDIVDAILTKDTITCPTCKIEVRRS
jgi:hypothetical protein